MMSDQEKIAPKSGVSSPSRFPANVCRGSSRRRLVIRREHRSPLLASSAWVFAPLVVLMLVVGDCGDGSADEDPHSLL
jgi:hypothetical protein